MSLIWMVIIPAAVTAAWFRYRSIAAETTRPASPKPFLSNPEPENPWGIHSHQRDTQWLHELFERSAATFPELTALSVACSGETLSYKALNERAEQFKNSIGFYLSGPDQVVAVRLEQNTADIVAIHLAILKAGGVQLFLDPEAPEAVCQQTLLDAAPVLLISDQSVAGVDVPVLRPDELQLNQYADAAAQNLEDMTPRQEQSPVWLDDPQERLASIFYTSGTTGAPKGVECHHAGYINLAKSYAQFFDLVPESDATSLTSSLGYDGSISEMYSAWLAGCEVVLLTKAELRSGPGLLPVLRQHNITTLFCPPVLLSTLTDKPATDLPYPVCRYIVPAGEAFPASLVPAWSAARRQIVNTYGPTEVSTDTSRQLLRPDEPVTIGSPFPGVSYHILEPGTLRLMPHGEEGELCIGGCQLARGYRSLDVITREKFIHHPTYGRLYRSGDRCHVDAYTMRVHFHGRLDSQLKVRGFRVEAQPIESILQDHFADVETAVLDSQNNELVALVRSPKLWQESDERGSIRTLPSFIRSRAQALIGKSHPPHAIPTRFFMVDKFELVGASGKIDRQALPQISQFFVADSSGKSIAGQESESNHERDPAVLAMCRAELGASLDWHDDFMDWGAHSIAIAQLTQTLQSAGYDVSVRSLLSDHRSAEKIADLSINSDAAAQTRDESVSARASKNQKQQDVVQGTPLSFRHFSLMQAVGAITLRLPLFVFAVLGLAIVNPEELLLARDITGFITATIVVYALYMLVPFVNLLWIKALGAVMRWSGFLSEIAPGRYQKFSAQHLQLWWAEQQADFVIRPLSKGLRSQLLYNWMLRELGANVHASANISQSTEWLGPLSLLTVERNAIVQAGAQISMVVWEGEHCTVNAVHICAAARVGSRGMLYSGAYLGANSWLTPMSSLSAITGENVQVDGVPGRVVGAAQPFTVPQSTNMGPFKSGITDARNVFFQMVLELALIILPGSAIALVSTYVLGFDAFSKAASGIEQVSWPDLLAVAGAGTVGIWLGVLTSSLLLCGFLRLTPTRSGWISSTSLHGTLARYRQQKMNQVQHMWGWSLTGQYLRALAGVKFSKVGASECDALVNLLPEHLTADANIFVAQGCYCNVLDEHGGFLLARPVHLPGGFFASNNAMVESGPLPGNLLLGVSTGIGPHLYRNQYQDRPDTPRVLAGNPPLEIGTTARRAQPVHPSPSLGIFLARFLLNDFASVAIVPGLAVFLGGLLLITLNTLGFSNIVAALITSLFAPFLLFLIALGLKNILVGVHWGRDNTTPFWSIRHFSYFLAQDCFFKLLSGTLTAVSGTALANPILRRFGCRIGKRSLIGQPLQMSDWHAVDIGSDCIVNGQLQLHSFEERLLTVKRSKIGTGTVINCGSMLMGGANLEAGVNVHPQSLIFKAMHLSRGTHAGNPATPLPSCAEHD